MGDHRHDLVLAQLHRVAVLGDHAGERIDASGLRGARVRRQHPVLAMDGDEAARTDEVDHHPLLALAGVPAGVHQLGGPELPESTRHPRRTR